MKASELAYRAAQVIAGRGHCKHVQEDVAGRVCFFGALNVARGIPNLTAKLFPEPLSPIGVEWKFTFPYGGVVFPDEGVAVLSSALLYADVNSRVVAMAEAILKERGEKLWQTPHLWNDQEGVTGEDVILLLKEVAVRLEEAGD